MAYEMIQNGKTQFAIDWDIVRRLLKSYWTALMQYEYGREVALSDSHWYNPMSWSLPDVSHVEVDWERVRTDALANTNQEVESMRRQANNNAASVGLELFWRVKEAARYKELFVDWMGDLQTQNMQNISKSVDAYESKVEIARFVRDTSNDGLMVGASVMGGGVGAWALMGVGSYFKGQATFQDTGNVNAAVMEGVGSLVFAGVKLGKAFSFKKDMGLVIVQATWKTGTELVGGRTFGEAVTKGALKLTGPAVDRAFKFGLSTNFFDKLAVPIVITYGGENVAAAVLSKAGAKLVQGGAIEKGGKKLIMGALADPQASPEMQHQRSPLIAEATLTNKLLLYLGFVNMDNGIGRGW